MGKGDGASFSWWLEFGLKPVLGNYSPGIAERPYFVFRQERRRMEATQVADLSDAKALRYTLKVHAAIASADPTQDLRWVDDDAQIYQRAQVEPRGTMSWGRKLRLLAAYLPDAVLPISSTDHLCALSACAGLPGCG